MDCVEYSQLLAARRRERNSGAIGSEHHKPAPSLRNAEINGVKSLQSLTHRVTKLFEHVAQLIHARVRSEARNVLHHHRARTKFTNEPAVLENKVVSIILDGP